MLNAHIIFFIIVFVVVELRECDLEKVHLLSILMAEKIITDLTHSLALPLVLRNMPVVLKSKVILKNNKI